MFLLFASTSDAEQIGLQLSLESVQCHLWSPQSTSYMTHVAMYDVPSVAVTGSTVGALERRPGRCARAAILCEACVVSELSVCLSVRANTEKPLVINCCNLL